MKTETVLVHTRYYEDVYTEVEVPEGLPQKALISAAVALVDKGEGRAVSAFKKQRVGSINVYRGR